MSNNKRALRNSLILALVIAAIAIYQGENLLTTALSFAFSGLIFYAALRLSYQFSDKLSGNSEKIDPNKSTDE